MKRILSVDGGGMRGALTTCFLIELERQTGKPCREVFDMVAGTSTGALIAAGIAAGLPATQMLSIYRDRGKELFSSGLVADAKRLAQGYYANPNVLSKILREEFGAAAGWKLNDCPIRILLTAKHVSRRPWYFVRDNPRNARTTGELSLVECAVASAAAPTYFSPYYVSPSASGLVGWCYDGGLGTTGNPVHQACVEAFDYDNFDPHDTRVISLGTGFTPPSMVNPPRGLLDTITWVIDTLVDAPIDEQTGLVERYYPGIMRRFNWQLPQPIDMADISAVPGLISMGQNLASKFNWKEVLSS